MSNHGRTNKIESITFGSIISLNMPNFIDYYVYSEGFINSKLELKQFSTSYGG